MWIEREIGAQIPLPLRVFGKSFDGNVKELRSENFLDSIQLASIDASMNPFLSFEITIPAILQTTYPKVFSLSCDYRQPAELCVNYQSVFPMKDTISQGESLPFQIGVVNAGEQDAANFSVSIAVEDEQNIQRPYASFRVTKVTAGGRFDTTISITTQALRGSNKLIVTVDGPDEVHEQFKTNNSFVAPFFVIADTGRPYAQLYADGIIPMDGDFVRANPTLQIRVRDSNTATWTLSQFSLSLDGQPIMMDDPRVAFTTANRNEDAKLEFTPSLIDGDHTIEYNVRDAVGNQAFPNTLKTLLRVQSMATLQHVYTFPNPSAGAMAFYFLLTGKDVPEQFQIKIYSLAGRLLTQIDIVPDEIHIGYNMVRWDGRDNDGVLLANGVYFYKLVCTSQHQNTEMIAKMAILR